MNYAKNSCVAFSAIIIIVLIFPLFVALFWSGKLDINNFLKSVAENQFRYIYIIHRLYPNAKGVLKKIIVKVYRYFFRAGGIKKIVGILYIVADTAPLRQLGGGVLKGVWKINTSNSLFKPISDKKKSWAVLTKKVGPFWTGPFRIWAVLSWAVSDLGCFDYNSQIMTKSAIFDFVKFSKTIISLKVYER